MESLVITVNGIALDLAPGEEDRFYITVQNNDLLKGLASRQASFSRGLTLPATRKNLDLLEADRPINSNQVPTGSTPAQVFIEGYPVLNQAEILVTSLSQRGITATLFGGNAKFFRQLKENSIRELDLSAYSFEWNALTGIPQLRDTTRGVCTADSLFTDVESYEAAEAESADTVALALGELSLDAGGFWFYCYTLLEEIFKSLEGLTVDLSKVPEQFNKVALACPVPIYYEGLTKPPGYSATGTGPVTPNEVQENRNTEILAPTDFDDPDNLWNATELNYIIPTAGTGTVTLSVTGIVYDRPEGETRQSSIRVQINGQSTRTVFLDDTPSELGFKAFEVYINFSYNFNPGDKVRFIAQTFLAKSGGTKILFGQGQLIFKVDKAGNNPPTTITNPAEFLPDLAQKDFVSNMLSWFNLVPIEKDEVVSFVPMEEILQRPPSVKELGSINYTYISYLPRYGQENLLKYAENEKVLRSDTTGQFQLEHSSLDPEKVQLELLFSALDSSQAPGVERVNVPIWAYEYQAIDNNKMSINTAGQYTTTEANPLKVGDYILANGFLGLVYTIINDRQGLCYISNQNIQDQDWELLAFDYQKDPAAYVATLEQVTGEDYNLRYRGTQFTFANTSFKAARFPIELTFNSLLENYFKLTTEALGRPLALRAKFNITTREFFNLQEAGTLYVPSLGLNFYVNKVEQFKRKALTRVELLRI